MWPGCGQGLTLAHFQSLASTKFRRDGSHFAILWAIRAGIGRIRLAHTKAFVRAIRVGIGTGRLRDLAIRKWEPVSTKFRRFVGLPGAKSRVGGRDRTVNLDFWQNLATIFALLLFFGGVKPVTFPSRAREEWEISGDPLATRPARLRRANHNAPWLPRK